MSESLFLINQVIHDLQEDCDYRILWTSSSPDSPSYWLRLPGGSNVPEEVSLDELSGGIEAGRYSFAPDVWRPVKSGEAGGTAIRLRDKAWELISASKKLSSDGSTTLYHSNLNKMLNGGAIKEVTMLKICKVLQMKPEELFVINIKD